MHDTNHHVVHATADSSVWAWLGIISAVQHTCTCIHVHCTYSTCKYIRGDARVPNITQSSCGFFSMRFISHNYWRVNSTPNQCCTCKRYTCIYIYIYRRPYVHHYCACAALRANVAGLLYMYVYMYVYMYTYMHVAIRLGL